MRQCLCLSRGLLRRLSRGRHLQLRQLCSRQLRRFRLSPSLVWSTPSCATSCHLQSCDPCIVSALMSAACAPALLPPLLACSATLLCYDTPKIPGHIHMLPSDRIFERYYTSGCHAGCETPTPAPEAINNTSTSVTSTDGQVSEFHLARLLGCRMFRIGPPCRCGIFWCWIDYRMAYIVLDMWLQ